jgi:excisionase family DNA binding protein
MTHTYTMESLYTPLQVAELLQVTRRTIYIWIKTKKLAAVRAGNRVRIPAKSVETFLKKH